MELWKEFKSSAAMGAAFSAALAVTGAIKSTAKDFPDFVINQPDIIQNPVVMVAGRAALGSLGIGMAVVPTFLFGAAVLGGVSVLSENYKESLQSWGRILTSAAAGQAAVGGLAVAGFLGANAVFGFDDKPHEIDPSQYIKRIHMNGSSDLNSRSMPPAVLIPARTHNL